MNRISIVVTLYKTEPRIRRLLVDLRRTLENAPSVSLILVNDHSRSSKVHNTSLALKKMFPDRIKYFRNSKNLGYMASLRVGIALTDPQTDLVLLNCDTRVSGDWCKRLQQAAYTQKMIASAMPLTNNLLYASVWNPPQRSDEIEKQTSFIDNHFSKRTKAHQEVPSTFGFCMFIKREAWRKVGTFDEALFSPGYGEEVDWCFRGSDLGFKHILCSNVFVYHHGGASFSNTEALRLNRKSSLILKFKYPQRWKQYARFLASGKSSLLTNVAR